MSAPGEQDDTGPKPRDYTALIIIAVFGLAELGLLFLLIAVETPISPLVRKLMTNPFGVLTVVMTVVTLLIHGMVAVLTLVERAARKKNPEKVI